MDWKLFLSQEASMPYFQAMIEKLDEAYAKTHVYPPREQLFACFDACPLADVSVVIIGQDPYHQPHLAHGLCFSVQPGVKVPPSLKNIYKERLEDVGIPISNHGYLMHWAKQGVLMMNAVMSVEEGRPGIHKKYGWETFSDHVLAMLNEQDRPIVYILWGNFAISKAAMITNPKQVCLSSAHPSPLSAYQGFFGSKPFSKTNAILKANGLREIDWSNDDVSGC